MKTVAVYSTEDANTYPVRVRRRDGLHRPRSGRQKLPGHVQHHSGAPPSPAPTPSTPATASWRKTPTSREPARTTTWCSSALPPSASSRMGDKSYATRDHEGVRRAHRTRLRRLPSTTVEEARHSSPRAWATPCSSRQPPAAAARACARSTTPPTSSTQYQAARAEAGAAFGNDGVYLEKLVLRPRHVEVQVLADDFGNNVAACASATAPCSAVTRSFSKRRRSPALTRELRRDMWRRPSRPCAPWTTATPAPSSFCSTSTASFYFMEMNTRVQVEHPVTEEITGTDIIKEQLRIASGEPMSCADRRAVHAGRPRHGVPHQRRGPRARLPPVPRHHHALRAPGGPGRARGGLRALRFARSSPSYDSLVAKLIVYGQDRDASASPAARRALDEFVIEGIRHHAAVPSPRAGQPGVLRRRGHDGLHRNPDGRCVMTRFDR